MPSLYIRRRTGVQLIVLAVVTVVALVVMSLTYLRLPALLFGAGRYTVTVELERTAGLYPRANVTYRGTEVGQVTDVRLTADGAEAVLSLKTSIPVPSDLEAQVRSQTAVGEQYVELLPRNNTSPPLRGGDVIHASVPPDINALLDAANRGLLAIPGDNLKTVVDESYIAFGGLGPDISRIVKATASLSIDARAHLNDLTNLADNSEPLLNSRTHPPDAVQAWAAHLATVTGQLRTHDRDLVGILQNGPAAFDETRQLLDRIRPTLPIVLANLATVAPVLITYQANLEQLLVLLPMGVQLLQGTGMADHAVDTPYRGFGLNFNMNFNVPAPCMTGFLPAQQIRSATDEDYPDRPPGDFYCRIPQDSPNAVRGARNIPCETRPGKRAPTVAMCESDDNYVPLNDGFNWKGDPNATLSGQDVPQLPPGPHPLPADESDHAAQSATPPAVTQYDPATGSYIGPDGKRYTRSDLAQNGTQTKSWQSMLLPPNS
ncbi:mammalian cell entry protein [Mycolicibacterium litorale]|nr:mammalian cell entry protein [Mycolicibacterium litorale]